MALLDPEATTPDSELQEYFPSVTKSSSKLVDFYTHELEREREVIARYKTDFDNFGYATSIELAG